MPNRILVVDDESAIRDTLIEHLSQCGYLANGAESGNEAYRVIQNTPYDFVLTDVRMGNGNGIELVEKVAELGDKKPMVAVMSGYTDVTVAELLARGATDLFSKPFELVLFDLRVRKLLTPAATRWLSPPPSTIDYTHRVASLESARVAGEVRFGNGGVFVAVTEKFVVGKMIRVQVESIDFPEESFAFEGQVRWNRLTGSKYFHSGTGLEFIGMDPKAIASVELALKKYPVQSFVPIGDRPTGT